MQIYDLVDLSKMGKPHEEFGQTYWGTTDKGDHVRFSKKSIDIVAPCTITAESATHKPEAKNPYYQLSKVNVAEKTPETVASSDDQPSRETPLANHQLDRIELTLQEIDNKLDRLMGGDI
jgi:hypothetical protein